MNENYLLYIIQNIWTGRKKEKRQERHEMMNENYLLYIIMDTSAGCGTGSGTGRRGTKFTLLKLKRILLSRKVLPLATVNILPGFYKKKLILEKKETLSLNPPPPSL